MRTFRYIYVRMSWQPEKLEHWKEHPQDFRLMVVTTTTVMNRHVTLLPEMHPMPCADSDTFMCVSWQPNKTEHERAHPWDLKLLLVTRTGVLHQFALKLKNFDPISMAFVSPPTGLLEMPEFVVLISLDCRVASENLWVYDAIPTKSTRSRHACITVSDRITAMSLMLRCFLTLV